MASKRTTHNLRLIRKDYTYLVQEVADMFNIHTQTVHRWVEQGLPTLPHTRPFHIYSGDLHDFLSIRQAKRKHDCQSNQIFCFKCRLPRGMKQGTLTSKPMRNKCTRVAGRCSTCGTKVHKVLGIGKWTPNHPLYAYIQPSLEPHNGTQQPQPACQVQKGAQLWLDLTP